MEYKAYAKVNLCLGITGRDRQDYHMLDTVMSTVDLYDTVQINFRQDNQVNVTFCPDTAIDPVNNTAAAAARIFAGDTGGANMHITKGIPVMAGLGGSSVDGAAVIRAYIDRYKLVLTAQQKALVRQLGSDIPFLIEGGAARCTRRGEEITRIYPQRPLHLVIAMDYEVSTAQCFLQYRTLNNTIPPYSFAAADCIIKAWQNYDLKTLGKALFNDLEESAHLITPTLYKTKEALLSHTSPLGVTMTGSGGAYIALYADKNAALAAEHALQSKVRFVKAVSTI